MDNSTRLITCFNNLTVSGTLQSFQTSLLATSHTNLQTQVNNLNNATLGTSINNHTTSINNLNVSSSVLDGKIGTIIGISIPQSLTRNKTALPSTFRNSNINNLGTSAYTGLGNIDTSSNYNFYVGGREKSFSIKKDTSMALVACGQDMQSKFYFGTPFGIENDGNKVSLISQGQSNTSIGKLYFCLNNNTSNP